MNDEQTTFTERTKPQFKHCENCNTLIKAYGNPDRRLTKRFCSRMCRGLYQTKTSIKIDLCRRCGKQVFSSGSQKTKGMGIYCSRECYGMTKRSPYYAPDENAKIRSSWAYIQWRKAVFIRDDYTCQFCQKRGVKIHADHIKPFGEYPDLRLDVNNGRTLCVPCHRKTPTYGGRKRSKLY